VSWRAWSAFAALGIIWGLPYFFIKLAVLEVSPSVIACSRVLLGTVILLPIAWRRGALPPLRRHTVAICGFALAEFVIPFSAISWGERWISSSVTGILIAMVPLSVVLMQRFFGLHERLGLWRFLGLGLGFIGVAALLGLGTIEGTLQWAGVACMLVATLGYAIGPLIIQRHLAGLDPFGPLAASLLVATLVLAAPAILTLPSTTPSTQTLVSLGILGVICTALAMLLMFYLVGHAGASRAAVITYINPAVATLLGVGLLHEPLGAGTVVAFALILVGSWLATRGSRSAARATARASA
jgi:drug/metabolite transporter (DMT)-like permease